MRNASLVVEGGYYSLQENSGDGMLTRRTCLNDSLHCGNSKIR